MRRGWLIAPLLLCGCGRYATFTLPPLAGGDPSATYQWQEESGPVLGPGVNWESRDVLNPVVLPPIPGHPWLNLYSGFDGKTWRTGLAISADGLQWQRQGMVLAPDPKTWEGSYIAANGAALTDGRQYWYWYQAGPEDEPRIGLARSGDGRTWRKEAAAVLETGPRGAWDERGVADPYVMRIGATFYLFYLGQDRARRQRLGLARSSDGIHWEKLRANPVLALGEEGAFDENGLGEPAVWIARGFYWMLYTGRDVHEYRRLGLARSRDGAHWTKLPAVFTGAGSWDSKVVCDPSVIATGSLVRVWFGGGDVAHPVENIHGQIGYGTLQPVNATLAK